MNNSNLEKKWYKNTFESSTGRTPEFIEFLKDVKKYLTYKCENTDLKIKQLHGGHFYFYGFLENKKNGKLVYFSCSDVRHFPDEWFNHLLIRTAENDTDWTGGSNNYCRLPEIADKAKQLTN